MHAGETNPAAVWAIKRTALNSSKQGHEQPLTLLNYEEQLTEAHTAHAH